MAARYTPWEFFSSRSLHNGSYAPRYFVPGIPPGRTNRSPSENSHFSNRVSALTSILCAPVIASFPMMDVVQTSTPALLKISTTVRPSISSKPSARNTYALFMFYLRLFWCFVSVQCLYRYDVCFILLSLYTFFFLSATVYMVYVFTKFRGCFFSLYSSYLEWTPQGSGRKEKYPMIIYDKLDRMNIWKSNVNF